MKRTIIKATKRMTAGSREPVPALERPRMAAELRETGGIVLSALDALSTQLAILDSQGRILAVNKAWREFAHEKKAGTDRGVVGASYFAHCAKSQSRGGAFTKFGEGVRAVVRGKCTEFAMEYLCDVRGEKRWFHGKVTRLAGQGAMRIIVTHEDISQRVQMEREVVGVSERERQRFGQELHRGLSQQLTGLKFKVSLLEYRLQSKRLPEATDAKAVSELLNQAMDEGSKLARSVHPVEVESRGLMIALKELAAKTERAHDVKCVYEFRRLVFIHDNNVATSVYRIAEDAIANALQHGHARQIWIALSETKGCVMLIVRDDGDGLPAKSSEEGGLGLRMMRYRARTIGGSIELRRNVKGGTTMTCSFPKRGVAIPAKTSRRDFARD